MIPHGRRMMRPMRLAPSVGLLLVALAAAAPAPAAELPPACAADVQHLCPNDKAGSARQASCVKQHQSSLTPVCKQSLAKQAQAAAAACRSDIAKFCPGVRPVGGDLAKCMKPHTNELSPHCRATADNL